jgi:type III pantothenate kinase
MDFQSIALPTELRYRADAGANIELFFTSPKFILKINHCVSLWQQILGMILVIDIGNTLIKAAVFEQNTLLELQKFEKNELQKKVLNILKKFPKIQDLVVSSVGNTESLGDLPSDIRVHYLTNEWKFPFSNHYSTPKTLGADRMVLASGAVLGFPKQNRLIIDAGTCITYDFVNCNDHYIGGGISPGLGLRFKALHTYTAKLPLLALDNPEDFIGNSTQQSILSGVVQGVVHEIDGFVLEYQNRFPNIITIFTGGDAVFLAKRLKNTIFANSNFLLESLNQTFQYKIKND